MDNYKELEVWQKSVALAVGIYKTTEPFPATEKYGLVSQIRRAAASVPANIAEGWGRGSTGEYIQSLLIARGSLMELETHLIISQKLDYLTERDLRNLQNSIEVIARMTNRLVGALKARQRASRSLKRESRVSHPETRIPNP